MLLVALCLCVDLTVVRGQDHACSEADPLAGRKFLGFQAVPIDNFDAAFLRGIYARFPAARKHHEVTFQSSIMFLAGGFARFRFEADPLSPELRCEGTQALRYHLTPLHHESVAENGAFLQPAEHADDDPDGAKAELLRWALTTFASPRSSSAGDAEVKARAWLVTLDARPCPSLMSNSGFAMDMRPAHSGMLKMVYVQTKPGLSDDRGHVEHTQFQSGGGGGGGMLRGNVLEPPLLKFKGHKVPAFYVDAPFSSALDHWGGTDGRKAWYAAHAEAPLGQLFFQLSCPNLPTMKSRSPSCLKWG